MILILGPGAPLVHARRRPQLLAMPVLQLDDRQVQLPVGTSRVGTGAGVDVPLPLDDAGGVLATIDVVAGGRTTIRRDAAGADVRVNGVALGAEPTPLLHGDKVEIGGQALFFAEDDKAGDTRYVSAADLASLASRPARPGRATKASGGRLLSLLDGKEYPVAAGGVLIGRDASCQVVVPATEVSRHHAEIVPDDQGYVLRDLSTNGVLVNGERVDGARRLARGDVVRVGPEEFRFSADVPTPILESTTAPAPPVGEARDSHAPAAPAAVDAEAEARRRALPAWVWLAVALLVAAGAFFVMQGR